MRNFLVLTLMLLLFAAASAAPRMALVKVAAACLRSQPAHSSELETQATYGTPLEITESSGEWHKAVLPDGYSAWITASAITPLTDSEFTEWRKAPRLIVTAPLPTVAYADSLNEAVDNVAFDVVLGAIFEGVLNPGARFAEIVTPDGRSGFITVTDVADFAEWAVRPESLTAVMDAADSMNGVTYLWGGTTPKALDCSGLTKVCYGASGLILPRNASQQALVGRKLDVRRPETFRRGDLLFFGNGEGKKITHVGIYKGNGQYIHSSGRVFRSSFDSGNPLYLPRKVIAACRILGDENRVGISDYRNHQWYFSKD